MVQTTPIIVRFVIRGDRSGPSFNSPLSKQDPEQQQMFVLATWQGLQNDSISSGNTRLLMIFVGIVALSMASQAIVVIFAAIAARKTQSRVLQIAEELRARATPIIDSAEALINDTLPKVRTITDNLLEASHIVRAKAQEFDSTLTDANKKTRAQVARVDGMVTTALTATGALAAMIHQGIRTPVIEAIGVVNGLKAGIDVLLSKSKSFGRKPTSIQVYKGD